jgi:hypothetical protein
MQQAIISKGKAGFMIESNGDVYYCSCFEDVVKALDRVFSTADQVEVVARNVERNIRFAGERTQ